MAKRKAKGSEKEKESPKNERVTRARSGPSPMKAPTKAGAASMARKMHVEKIREEERRKKGNDPNKDKNDGEYDDELERDDGE